MRLTNTTHSIEVVTSAASDLHYEASWGVLDKSGASTSVDAGSSHGVIGAATTTTIVAAPSSGVDYVIKALHLRNAGALNQTVTVQKDVSGTDYAVAQFTLQPGWQATYTEASGWGVRDASGVPLGTSAVTTAGSSGAVQYNNAGALGGAGNVAIDGGNLQLAATTDPSPPASGLLLYAKSMAGRLLPKILGPIGIDTALQVGLHGNAVMVISPANGTAAPNVWGGSLTSAATMSSQITIASANPWQATWRKRFQTSTSAGNVSGMRTPYAQYFRGSAGYGGFFFRAQFGHNINLNGGQKFIGLCASLTAIGTAANSVSALLNMCGVGYDSSDASSGNWYFLCNDGSGTATKVDLGSGAARANTTHGYDLVMVAPQNGATTLYVFIRNLHDGTVILDTSYTTDLPTLNVGMAFKCEVTNAAVAAADNIECAKVYIETDY